MTGTLARPDTATDWRLGRMFTVRVAGLPLAVLAGLRCAATRDWAASVLSVEDELARDAVVVSDLLHEVVGATEEGPVRRRLLALRRQVFNNALPAPAEELAAVLRRGHPRTAALLADWLDRRRRLEQARRTGADLLAGELALTRGELTRLAGEPCLRSGLHLASPALAAQLAVLATTAGGAAGLAGKRQRKLERSLLSYVYRTAAKTSPFSTLTAVAVGDFAGSGPDPAGAGFEVEVPVDRHGYARLNVVVLGRLGALIAADRTRRVDLPVALSPGWRLDGDRVRYVRHWTTVGDGQSAVSFDAIRDGLFFLRRSGTLDQLTELFAERRVRRCGEVAAWLAARVRATAEESERYLSVLLDLGILQLCGFQADVHTPDPLRALRAALTTVDRPWAARLARRLDQPIALVDAYPAAGPDDRGDLLGELRRCLQSLFADLSPAQPPTLPASLVYEDVCAATAAVRADGHAFAARFGRDLAAVERILPAYDLNLPHRMMLRGFFLARFGPGGRCDDLLRLVEDFHDDVYEQYSSYTADRRPFAEDGRYTPEENWLGRPELTAIDAARQDLAAYLREVFDARGDEPEVHLDRDRLAGIGAGLAAAAGDPGPQGHFVQLAAASGPLLVLNQSFGGLSFPFSRFTGCFTNAADAGGGADTLVGRLRDRAAAIAPPGAVFAEVTGGPATTNLNLHARLTEYVIVCPGEDSTVPAQRRLTLDDLYLAHEERTDRVRLCSVRLGCEVVPVYLGYLLPMALPRIPRTLLLLSGAAMVRLDIWTGVPAGAAVDGVTRRPRVRLGDVVLGRRSWSLAARELPARAPGAGDADRYLQWQRWRRGHGIPARVFATVYPTSWRRGAGPPKPQYVDFDSYLSLLAFEALPADGADRVVLREPLPDEDGLTARCGTDRYVAEFAIETHHAHGEGTQP